MNSLDLNAFMHYDIGMKKISGGVWPADALLYLRCTRPMFLIVNTSESNSVGSHWVALYLPSRGPIEFFDPLGKPPFYYHDYFHAFLESFGEGYLWNNICYQRSGSILCGEYSLFFGYYRSRGLTMRQVLARIRMRDDDQLITFYNTVLKPKL